MEKRPHYALDDLLAVEGIGRGRLDKIDRNTVCATPITVDGLIPAIPETACAAGQVDAAIAPRQKLMAPRGSGGLGLAGPVADRLLARRTEHPFPTLEHLTIIEGIGDGRLKQWVRDGVICVTPAPFIATTTAGDMYKASLLARDRGETIGLDTAAGAFALGVPAGVLDQPHAWATVVDIPDVEHRGPRADFHIHGPWQSPGEDVFLTVPADPYQQIADVPTVPAVAVNADSPDAELHLRSRLAQRGGSWIIASDHLSTAEAAAQFGFVMFYLPTDRGRFGDQAEAWAREHLTQLSAPAPTCTPDITHADEVDVRTQPVSLMTNQNALGRPIFHRCVQGTVHDPRVNFTFVNSSALAYRLPGDQAFPVVDMTDMTLTTDPISQAMFELQDIAGPRVGFTNTDFVLPPTATVVGSLGFPHSVNYHAAYDPINTAGYWAARNMSAVLPADEAQALAALSCTFDLVRPDVTYETVVDCAEGAGSKIAKAASRMFLFLDSGHTLVDTLDAARARIGFGDVDGDWHFHRHHPPVTPAPGTEFGGGHNPNGGPDGTITVDGGINIPHDVYGHGTDSGTVYMVYDNSGLAYGMNLANPADYATYDCLARRYPMRSYLPIDKLGAYGHFQETIYDASCNDTTPARVTPANATNFILRETTGTSWFIDANSDLHWIPDGNTFICLAQRYYVLDHTPWNQISQFEDPTYAGEAHCP